MGVTRKALTVAILAAAATITLAVATSAKTPPAAAATPSPSTARAHTPTTAKTPPSVTITVTGNAPAGVDITWGTDSSNHQAVKLPFTVTVPLDSSGNTLYYDVSAQLQGRGDIACSVAVNGSVLKSGSASGGYNICSSQIGQNPLTGQWEGE